MTRTPNWGKWSDFFSILLEVVVAGCGIVRPASDMLIAIHVPHRRRTRSALRLLRDRRRSGRHHACPGTRQGEPDGLGIRDRNRDRAAGGHAERRQLWTLRERLVESALRPRARWHVSDLGRLVRFADGPRLRQPSRWRSVADCEVRSGAILSSCRPRAGSRTGHSRRRDAARAWTTTPARICSRIRRGRSRLTSVITLHGPSHRTPPADSKPTSCCPPRCSVDKTVSRYGSPWTGHSFPRTLSRAPKTPANWAFASIGWRLNDAPSQPLDFRGGLRTLTVDSIYGIAPRYSAPRVASRTLSTR